MMNREIILGRKRGFNDVLCMLFVLDIAYFMLKWDQPTNQHV